ncbi:MAG: zinc ribbon domain-containing protein [Methanobacterium sp.]
MKCSNCGTENPEDSQFCTECGNKLERFNRPVNVEKGTVQPKKSNRNKIIIGGVVVVVVLIFVGIILAGSNSSIATGNSTYNINDVSFSYPNSFVNASAPSSIISGGSTWQQSGFLLDNNSGINIQIQTNPNTAGYTLQELILADEASVKQNNGSVLSTTNTTNPNGVVVAGDIETLTDPTSNTPLRYYDMIFSESKGTVYSISVYGDDSDNTQIQQVQQTIFNSLKVS